MIFGTSTTSSSASTLASSSLSKMAVLPRLTAFLSGRGSGRCRSRLSNLNPGLSNVMSSALSSCPESRLMPGDLDYSWKFRSAFAKCCHQYSDLICGHYDLIILSGRLRSLLPSCGSRWA